MQRIADRIQREFSSGESYIEISALDGNGGKSLIWELYDSFLIISLC
jgi:hypothetical protein